MLRQRLLVVAVLLPVGLWVFARGGVIFAVAMALVVALAAREYALLFGREGQRPAMPILVVGSAGLVLARQAWGLEPSAALLAAAALLAMTWHLVDFERGAPRSGTDLGLTLGGVVYLGVVGAYLVSLRNLDDGLWWLLISLPAVWIGDSAAYFIGRAYGRHKMSPRLSPKKSWEGYVAGVVAAALSGTALAALFTRWPEQAASIMPADGLMLGLALGGITPLG